MLPLASAGVLMREWMVVLLSFIVGCIKPVPSVPVMEDTTVDEPDVLPACDMWGDPEPVGRVADAALTEISGLVVSRLNPGVLWIMEDSGAQPELVALDMDGQRLGVVRMTGVTNTDWEDLAIGPCEDTTCLWVGDFGDNSAMRSEVSLLRIVEPELSSQLAFTYEIEPTVQRYTYPEGPQDVEALVVSASGEPHVLTKRGDATSRIYRIPFTGDGLVAAELLNTITTGSIDGLPTAVTAADTWSDGSRLLVRCYLVTFELRLGSGTLEDAGNADRVEVVAALEGQGEAIAYDVANNAIWHVSEGVQPTLFRIPCLDDIDG